MLPLETLIDDERRRLDAPLARRVLEAVKLLNRLSLGSEHLRRNLAELGGARTKEDRSPVTVADLLHQGLVQQWIARLFPGDGLICEEPRSLQEAVMHEAQAAADRFYGMPLEDRLPDLPERAEVTWILDPIDGTKGYLAGRYYAIALGFFVGDQPWFGAMAVPPAPAMDLRISRRIGFAISGVGGWVCDIVEAENLMCQKLEHAEATPRDPVRVAMSLEHGKTDERIKPAGEDDHARIEIVKLDSQAKYLAVALGEIDAYLRDRRDDGQSDVAWDHMPGAVIARAAGCSVTHYDGGEVRFEPQRELSLKGGLACYRGGNLGPVGKLVQRLVQR